ncbi:cytochrome P450 [Aspergillus affinis]|uniref:cytochrome P450 n=1 Tax=Aspergillus affinis TaxID=1070780 RepID=UPI0022FE5325|nr:cytochrome P450 [Aspergillus affinis]KAI9039701.1 cytochrome P450 [Aspergillus affinis]
MDEDPEIVVWTELDVPQGEELDSAQWTRYFEPMIQAPGYENSAWARIKQRPNMIMLVTLWKSTSALREFTASPSAQLYRESLAARAIIPMAYHEVVIYGILNWFGALSRSYVQLFWVYFPAPVTDDQRKRVSKMPGICPPAMGPGVPRSRLPQTRLPQQLWTTPTDWRHGQEVELMFWPHFWQNEEKAEFRHTPTSIVVDHRIVGTRTRMEEFSAELEAVGPVEWKEDFSTIFGLSFRWLRAPNLPTINAYPGDFTKKKAREEFLSDAQTLLAEGARKFNGPFRIVTSPGSRVILPKSWTPFVKSCKELDHLALVRAEYFGGIPGLEGLSAFLDPNHILIDVIKMKLSQNHQCQTMHDHSADVMEETWTKQTEWHLVDFSPDILKFTARVASSIFVGHELARNQEWQTLITTYTVAFFNSVRALRNWPKFLHPVIHWVLPDCQKVRGQVRLARRILTPVLEERTATKKSAETKGHKLKFDDTIEWTEEVAKGRPYDPIAIQLGLAMGALHTTTQLMQQAILDICAHQDLIKPLREEIAHAVQESGWTTAGLFKMKLLDSVIKETQRLKPGLLANLERTTTDKVTLPNGITLPPGTNVGVECNMWSDAETYSSPEKFDGYRFLRMREAGDNTAVLSATNSEHVAFGIGRSLCPGRFMAASEIKIVISRLLLDYDIRLAEGYKPRVIHYGFEMLSDPLAKVEVRKRSF